MRVAVSGAGGRLGRALISALEASPFVGPSGPIAWVRPEFDVDATERFPGLIARDRPEVVVHAAAWTDVDGCAREPDLALRRNGMATRLLAEACRAAGADLLVISTNEVFDGRRTDGLGYRPDDPTGPINAYGASKLAGEAGARDAYAGAAPDGPVLGIVRTAWLYGPPGRDFPAKILDAAERARTADEPLRLVADEVGSPTYTNDLAEAIVELIGAATIGGTHHVVNAGIASRADWARELLRLSRIDISTEDVPGATWPRASTPPAWAVLAPTPLPGAEPLRPWQAALADYLPELARQRSRAAAAGR